MEDIEKLIGDLSITKYEKGSFHWVDVSCITDPHNFYVRPTKYNEFLKRVESTEPTTKVNTVNVHDLVVFNWGFSCGVKTYLRGRILTVETNDSYLECDIFTIDYGCTEKAVPIEQIWKCDEIFSKVPPLASICQLSNCNPIKDKVDRKIFSTVSINAFKCYVANEPARMNVVGKIGGKLLVDLVNSNPDDIATLMAMRAFSEIGNSKDPIKWKPTILRREEQFKFKEIKLKETLHVRMLSGMSLQEFYVATVSDYRKHLKEIDFITFYARREFVLCEQDYYPGTPVCAKDDVKDIYERAFIKKLNIPDKKATVQLVDSGKDEEFPLSKLKYMSAICLRTPVLAIFCTAEESKFCEGNLKEFLTPGFEFLITIKRLGHEFECPNAVDITPYVEQCEGATALLDDVDITPYEEQCEGATALLNDVVDITPYEEQSEGAAALLDDVDITPKKEQCEGATALLDDVVDITPKKEQCEGATALLDDVVNITPYEKQCEGATALLNDVVITPNEEQCGRATALLDNVVNITPCEEQCEGATALLDDVNVTPYEEQCEEAKAVLDDVIDIIPYKEQCEGATALLDET